MLTEKQVGKMKKDELSFYVRQLQILLASETSQEKTRQYLVGIKRDYELYQSMKSTEEMFRGSKHYSSVCRPTGMLYEAIFFGEDGEDEDGDGDKQSGIISNL